MKITIESTTKIVNASGINCRVWEGSTDSGINCRVWEGSTDSGIKVEVLIPRIAVRNGQDTAQFERELKECRAPSPDVQAFPLRMIL